MSQLPKVTLLYANGNLLQDIGALDGVAAIMGTGTTVGLLGVPKLVTSLDDAVSQGFTEDDEPDMYRHLKEFYGELGVNQELYVMIVADTKTLADMLDNTSATSAKVLTTFAEGKIRLLGVYRNPGVGYDGGADFIDDDVAAAITNSKVFGEARLAELSPLRMLIEGRVENPAAANVLTPNTSTNGWAGVVLGGSLNDGSASVGLALGRAVKYGAEIKLGKVANGPLVINQVYIGDKLLKDVANLATLHGDGFISFMTHPRKAGFFFGIDRMCSTDDYRLLVYGRVIDKAAIISAAVAIEQIEDEVDTEADGKIASYVVSDLEKQIEQQINVAMAPQISGVSVYINPDQNIINTGTILWKLRIRPKGYKTYINIELGLIAPTA